MDKVTLREIGKRCRLYRLSLGYKQSDVAKETDYSVENISLFERGRNDNLMILMWYIRKGMSLVDLQGGGVNGV